MKKIVLAYVWISIVFAMLSGSIFAVVDSFNQDLEANKTHQK